MEQLAWLTAADSMQAVAQPGTAAISAAHGAHTGAGVVVGAACEGCETGEGCTIDNDGRAEGDEGEARGGDTTARTATAVAVAVAVPQPLELTQLHTAPTDVSTPKAEMSPQAPTTQPTAAFWIAAAEAHWQAKSALVQPALVTAAERIQLLAHEGTAEIRVVQGGHGGATT